MERRRDGGTEGGTEEGTEIKWERRRDGGADGWTDGEQEGKGRGTPSHFHAHTHTLKRTPKPIYPHFPSRFICDQYAHNRVARRFMSWHVSASMHIPATYENSSKYRQACLEASTTCT